MEEMIISFVVATFFGVVSGLVPGVGVFVTLSLMYPFLITLDPINVLAIYVIVSSLSQYFGSVSATVFAVPGSMTSIPSLIEGHELFRKGDGDRSIMYAALGSFIGSVLSIFVSYLFIQYSHYMFAMFDTRIKMFLVSLCLLAFVLTSKNKYVISGIFIGFGFILGHIGLDRFTNSTFLTFGNEHLMTGLPTISVVLGLYVVPYILSQFKHGPNKIEVKKLYLSGYISSLLSMLKYWKTVLRGFFIGYVSGFVPGITYHLGTTLSYLIEKRIKKKKNNYEVGDIDCLIAAETANNSGVFSQMIPLLLIGLPITSGQALIYSIVESKGIQPTPDFFQYMLPYIALVYVLSAIVGVFIAGKYVNWIRIFSGFDFRYVYSFIIATLFVVAFVTGNMYGQAIYYVVVLLALVPVGYILKDHDRVPIVFAFLLHDTIYNSLITFNALYL